MAGPVHHQGSITSCRSGFVLRGRQQQMGSGIGFTEGEGPGPFVMQAVDLPGDFQIHSHLGPVIDLRLIHSGNALSIDHSGGSIGST